MTARTRRRLDFERPRSSAGRPRFLAFEQDRPRPDRSSRAPETAAADLAEEADLRFGSRPDGRAAKARSRRSPAATTRGRARVPQGEPAGGRRAGSRSAGWVATAEEGSSSSWTKSDLDKNEVMPGNGSVSITSRGGPCEGRPSPWSRTPKRLHCKRRCRDRPTGPAAATAREGAGPRDRPRPSGGGRERLQDRQGRPAHPGRGSRAVRAPPADRPPKPEAGASSKTKASDATGPG